jgi:hypothetical protein
MYSTSNYNALIIDVENKLILNQSIKCADILVFPHGSVGRLVKRDSEAFMIHHHLIPVIIIKRIEHVSCTEAAFIVIFWHL